MNPKQINLLLWFIAAILSAACVTFGYFGATSPLSTIPPKPVNTISSPRADGTITQNTPLTLDQLTEVSHLVLRQQLIEEKPVVVPEMPKPVIPEPKLDLQLTGTVIESDRQYAILSDARGATRLVRVGDEVKGAKVQTIAAESVTLTVGDREVTLEVIKSDQAGNHKRRR